MMSTPPSVVVRAQPHRAAGDQPDLELGARAAEPERVEREPVQRRRAGREARTVVAPGRDRIGRVEARGLGDQLPTAPSTSGSPSTRSAQAGVGLAAIVQLTTPEMTFGT